MHKYIKLRARAGALTTPGAAGKEKRRLPSPRSYVREPVPGLVSRPLIRSPGSGRSLLPTTSRAPLETECPTPVGGSHQEVTFPSISSAPRPPCPGPQRDPDYQQARGEEMGESGLVNKGNSGQNCKPNQLKSGRWVKPRAVVVALRLFPWRSLRLDFAC